MCYKPINVRQADGRYMKVKCGKCLECLNEKRNAWVIRMDEELKSAHGKGVFFTLTYSEDNIPKNFLVYETSFSDVPKLYESDSDYNYATPAGFRGKQSVSVPVDRVLQEFYKDYTITDFNIDNNYKKYKAYESIKDTLSVVQGIRGENDEVDGQSIPALDERFFGDVLDDDFYDVPYWSNSPCGSDYAHSSVFSDGEEIMPNEFFNDDQGRDYEQLLTRNLWWSNGAEVAPNKEVDFQEDAIAQDLYALQQRAVNSRVDSPSYVPESGDTADGEGDGHRERIKPYLVLSFNSVRQKDLQDWLKRGREKLRRQDKRFTYFVTSEYGPRTLRPHYHGCFFGVSLDDVRFMFDDWRARFGRRIKADNINSTAGCSYCAKYCAKGFYEHPLCSRDFFYTKKYVQTGSRSLDELMNRLEFSEYHSKHYERCMEYFGIDKPIVTPTFRLVSKGLGIGYIERTKDYFRLDEAEEQISLLKHSNDYDEIFTQTMEEIQRYFHYTSSQGFTYSMPQYYSAKMFSDNLRHAFAHYVLSQYDKLYYEQFRELQAAEPNRESAEILSQMEEEQRRTKIYRLDKKLASIEKYYNKSKI